MGLFSRFRRNKSESAGQNPIDQFKSKHYTGPVTVKTHDTLLDKIVSFPGTSEFKSYGQLFKEMDSVATEKDQLITKLNSIRFYDYVETLLRDVGTDVMTRSYDPESSEFFTFRSNKYEGLVDKVNSDIKNLRLYQVINDTIEDLLLIGEYIFKMDYTNDEIDDSLDQSKVLPAYSNTDIEQVYDGEERLIRGPSNYLILRLFSTRKRLGIKSSSGSYYYVKMPRGVIMESVIPKIMSLKLLETIQPLVELQAIDEKMFFYVRFPAGNDVKESYKQCRDYERLLKSLLSMDDISSLDINSVIQRATNLKVIPLFGEQNEMTQNTVHKINRIDLSQLEDLRRSISHSLKIKINDDNSTNPEYYKLVKRLRNKIKESVKVFIKDYVYQKYTVKLEFDEFSIDVPEVQGAEDIDTIDFINMHQSTYRAMWDLVVDTADNLTKISENPTIDKEALIEVMGSKLHQMIGAPVLKSYDSLQDELGKDPLSKIEPSDTR